jgi:uncharacterized integral membrane protein
LSAAKLASAEMSALTSASLSSSSLQHGSFSLSQLSKPSTESIWQLVDDLARRNVRVSLIRNALGLITLIGIAALLLGGLDFMVRWQSRFPIWLASMAFIGLAIGGILFIVGRLHASRGDQNRSARRDAARRIEQSLNLPSGQLTEPMSLQSPNSEIRRTGSAELHAISLEQAVSSCNTDEVDLTSLVDRFVNPLLICLITAAVLISIYAAFSDSARIAMERLTMPWAGEVWPRSTQLAFVELPDTVAVGNDVKITVTNRVGDLPSDLVLEIKNLATDEVDRRSIQDVALGDVPKDVSFLLANLQSPVSVRAIGGDDSEMAWRTIQTALGGRLEELTFHVEPPAYTSLPSVDISSREIRVLEGSTITMTGKISNPVREAQVSVAVQETKNASDYRQTTTVPYTYDQDGNVLPRSDVQPSLPESAQPGLIQSTSSRMPKNWTVLLDDDRQNFRIIADPDEPIVPRLPFRFDLTWQTQQGLSERAVPGWDVDVTRDAPPVIQLANTKNTSSTTVQGRVPIAFDVTEDFEIVRIDLQYRIMTESPVTFSQAKDPSAPDETFQTLPIRATADQPLTRSKALKIANSQNHKAYFSAEGSVAIQSLLEVSQIPNPSAVEFRISATDSRQQKSISESLTVGLISPTEMEQTYRNELLKVAEQVTQARDKIAESNTFINQLKKKAENANPKLDIEALRVPASRALPAQRSAAQILHEGARSAEDQTDSLLQRIQSSGLERGSLEQLLSDAKETVDALVTSELSQIDNAFGSLTDQITDEPERERVADIAREIDEQQISAIEKLDSLIESTISQNESLAVRQMISQTLSMQIQLADQTRELANVSNTQDQVQQIATLSSDQFSLSRKLSSDLLSISDPNTPNPLIDEQSARDVAGSIRQAARQLQSERLDLAIATQRAVISELRQLLNGREQIPFDGDSPATQQTDPGRKDTDSWQSALSQLLSEAIPLQGAVVDSVRSMNEPDAEISREPKIEKPDDRRSSDLADKQQRVREKCDKLIVSSKTAANALPSTYLWVLETATADMRRAEIGLRRTSSVSLVQRHAISAHELLKSIASTLEPNSDLADADGPSEMDPDSKSAAGQNSNNSQDSGVDLASLKLLRRFQAQLNAEVQGIQADRSGDSLTADQWLAVNALANKQKELSAQLAEIVGRLSQPPNNPNPLLNSAN